MIEFPKYAKIKDVYCLSYLGPSDDYLVLLRAVTPLIEARFPGLRLMFCCRDERRHLLGDPAKVIGVSELKARRTEFGHFREVRYNGRTHPVADLLAECGITGPAAVPPPGDRPKKCVIVTAGFYPTKPLEARQAEVLRKRFSQAGYDVETDGDDSAAGAVAGVESPGLFGAALRGAETCLVPTGVGSGLYKQLFSFGTVLNI